ncbi:hypothetical protein [Paenibacillus oryzisoli]|uniref:Uncharacterized protein n=1 Tax=Paenibacillus oryzisoli TaxID=1850517 RepID=A0A198AI18_9BACL|nr:hypothetical protein [Paenibacillus oryzisoli]OAS21149.1 hypothetical protein A8708_30120 [Paenibacillus oryzisoli]
MALADLTLVITNHAFEQYRERVEKLERNELHAKIKELLIDQRRIKGEFIKLDGVWWVFLIDGEELRLLTCYGRSTFDMPKALEWAKRHGDRIRLGEYNA